MLRRVMTTVDIKANLQDIIKRIDEVFASRPKEIRAPKPIIVAASKTHNAETIINAYNAGQRHFGENYVNELVEKGHHPDVVQNCPEIKWHYIGRMQSNKLNKILKVPNLYMIETVDSEKHAAALNNAWGKIELENKSPLRILIQINTSGEEVKGGIEPKDAPTLYKYIRENLKNLQLDGIMTIGAYGFDYSQGPNPDFLALMNVHRAICEANAIEPESLQVSMGMSGDYDKAIELGSTIVRIGTSIFGQRTRKISTDN